MRRVDITSKNLKKVDFSMKIDENSQKRSISNNYT